MSQNIRRQLPIELQEQMIDSLPVDSVTGEDEERYLVRRWQAATATLAVALVGSWVWFLVG